MLSCGAWSRLFYCITTRPFIRPLYVQPIVLNSMYYPNPNREKFKFSLHCRFSSLWPTVEYLFWGTIYLHVHLYPANLTESMSCKLSSELIFNGIFLPCNGHLGVVWVIFLRSEGKIRDEQEERRERVLLLYSTTNYLSDNT
jgi:hypothetical protein